MNGLNEKEEMHRTNSCFFLFSGVQSTSDSAAGEQMAADGEGAASRKPKKWRDMLTRPDIDYVGLFGTKVTEKLGKIIWRMTFSLLSYT